MTRTERDLRAVLEASEQQAPDPAAVLNTLKRRIVKRGQRRRTTGAYLAVALAVATMAMLPAALRGLGSAGVTAAASPSASADASPSTPVPTATPSPTVAPTVSLGRPLLTFTIRRGDAGNGMRIEPFVITPNRQWALVRQAGVVKGLSAELYVYEPGRLDVTRYLTGEALTVNGRPGYFKVAVDPDTYGTNHTTDRATVVWQYTPGAWALVMSTQDGVQKEQLVQVATSLVLDTPVAARVPFKTDYLPAGLRAVRLSQNLIDPANPSASVMFDVATANVSTIDNEDGLRRPLQITAMPAIPRLWRQSGTVGGYPIMRIVDSQIAVDVGGWWIELRTGIGLPPLTDADIELIMGGMTVATLSNPDTWFDATTAIPGGS